MYFQNYFPINKNNIIYIYIFLFIIIYIYLYIITPISIYVYLHNFYPHIKNINPYLQKKNHINYIFYIIYIIQIIITPQYMTPKYYKYHGIIIYLN